MPRIHDLKAGMNGGEKPAQPATTTTFVDFAGATSYALAALSRETLLVSTAPEGTRNDTLNRAAYNLAQLVSGGQLPGDLVVVELTQAGRAAGLGDAEIRQTLLSALPAGQQQPRTAPPAPDTSWLDNLPTQAPVTVDSPEDTEPRESAALVADGVFNRDVALELHREHVKDMARRMLKAEREKDQPRPRMVGLRDFLAEPDEDVEYRVQQLWPTGGRIVFAAQYKTGKSTAVGNVVRALADGTPLFDMYTTTPAGRIVLIDNELDERTLRRWLRDQGVVNEDAVTLIPLRGMVSAFDIMDPDTLQQWAEAIATTSPDVIILDCLRPVLDALGLSEDKDAGQFLVAFDALLRRSGATEALVVHHMGHSGQRSRGDSRILDWPDATWKLIRQDPDDLQSDRFFSAFGRDVDVPESMLAYDVETRHLAMVGGSRKRASLDELVERMVGIVTLHRALAQVHYLKLAGANKQAATEALREAVARGLLTKTVIGGKNIYDIAQA